MKRILLILGLLGCISTNAQRFVKEVNNVAELGHQSLADKNQSVLVRGYYSPNDGGGSLFVLTNAISGTNTGTRINFGSTNGSWERVLLTSINSKMFGAKIDGVTDDATATQNAINYSATNNFEYIQLIGNSLLGSVLTIPTGARIKGFGSGSILSAINLDDFVQFNSVSNIFVTDLAIQGFVDRAVHVTDSHNIVLQNLEISAAKRPVSYIAGISVESGSKDIYILSPRIINEGTSDQTFNNDFGIVVGFNNSLSTNVVISNPYIAGNQHKFGISFFQTVDCQVIGGGYIDMGNKGNTNSNNGIGVSLMSPLVASTGNTINDLTILNTFSSGLFISNNIGASISNVKLYNTSKSNLLSNAAAIAASSSSRLHIHDINISNSGTNSAIVLNSISDFVLSAANITTYATNKFAIEVLGILSEGTISDVIVRDGNGYNGFGGSGQLFVVTLVHNVLANALDSIIVPVGSQNVVVRGNIISALSGSGIVDNGFGTLIEGNVVNGSALNGILATGTGGMIKNNIISGFTTGLNVSGFNYEEGGNKIDSSLTTLILSGEIQASFAGLSYKFPLTNGLPNQILATDGATPSNLHWVTNSGGGASAPVGTMVESGISTAGVIPGTSDASGTNYSATPLGFSGTNVTSAGSLAVNKLVVTNSITINGVTYNFPASQGATNTFARNDGSGNITWSAGTGGGVNGSGNDTEVTYWDAANGILGNSNLVWNTRALTLKGSLNIGGSTASFPMFTNSGPTMEVRLADNSSLGDLSIRSGLITNYLTFLKYSSSLGTTNQIPATTTLRYVSASSNAVTLTCIPTIAAGSGLGGEQFLMLVGAGTTNTVTIQDEGTLVSSGLVLGAATRTLTLGQTLLLRYDTTAAKWREITYSGIIDGNWKPSGSTNSLLAGGGYANSLTASNFLATVGPGPGTVVFWDTAQTHHFAMAAPTSITTNTYWIPPTAPNTGFVFGTLSGGTNENISYIGSTGTGSVVLSSALTNYGTINPTDNYIPLRSNATTFGNSPLSSSAPYQVVLSSTNLATNPNFVIKSLGTNTGSAFIDYVLSDSDGSLSVAQINGLKSTGWGAGTPTLKDGVLSMTVLHDGSLQLRFQIDGNTGNVQFKDRDGVGTILEVSNASGYTGTGGLLLSDDGTYKSVKPLFTASTQSSVVNTNVEKSLLSSSSQIFGSKTIAANRIKAGSTIRMKFRGQMGSTATPTLRLKLKFGSTIAYDTGAVTLVSSTAHLIDIDLVITVDPAGASGVLNTGFGLVTYFTSSSTPNYIEMPLSTVSPYDFTSSQAIDLTAQWGTANALNSINIQSAVVEILND